MIKIEKSKILYDDGRFIVVEDEINFYGEKRTYKYLDKSDAIGIIPIVNDEIWLVEQYRHSVKRRLLEIPGGRMLVGENSIVAAKRELREETGLISGNLTKLLTLLVHPSICNEEIHIFLARDCIEGVQDLEESESDLNIVRVPLTEVGDMILRGQVNSSPDGYAIMFYLLQNSE